MGAIIVQFAQDGGRMRYTAHKLDGDGWTDWYRPEMRGYRMRCCDCALVHEVEFRVKGRRVQMRARRHEKATAASRRKKR